MFDTNYLIVIADDLTGANDTGVQFAKYGLTTKVMLKVGNSITTTADVLVVDTDSRASDSTVARKVVHDIAIKATQQGFTHFYKKVDSKLRGNIAAEINGILDVGLHDFALLIPAYPKNNCITVKGVHLVEGVPLAQTQIANDPKTPVKESCLPKLIESQTELMTAHIYIDTIENGAEAIAQKLTELLARGCRIISCDCVTDEQLIILGEGALDCTANILWCGSAGMAEQLTSILKIPTIAPPTCVAPNNINAPTLVIVGSLHQTSKLQTQELLRGGYELCEFYLSDFFHDYQNNVEAFIKNTSEKINSGKRIVIMPAEQWSSDAIEHNITNMSSLELSTKVAEYIGIVSSKIIELCPIVEQILLTGGDTAIAVCKALSIDEITIVQELLPGIPLGVVDTLNGRRMNIITKAGAFGQVDALASSIKKAEQRSW